MSPPFVSLADYEAHAREVLPQAAFDYYHGGADDEVTLRENRAAFDRIALHYHVLRGTPTRDLSRTVLGHHLRMPVVIAPVAMLGMAHPDGEAAAARAAAAAGSLFVLSTFSMTPVEDVVAAAEGGPVWFQLYVYKDRGATRALVQRAEAAGCTAIVLTVDAPTLGQRERDVRNNFRLPAGLWAPNLTADARPVPPNEGEGSELAATFAAMIDPVLTWDDVAWMRSVTSLPVLVKGVVRADDAVRAAEAGAAGIVVSNHSGRQLDTAPATIDVLGDVVQAVGGRAEVLLDCGVRRGTDVVKAVAHGARAVQIGRPVVWGLAAGGESGVAGVLEMLRSELDRALLLCGCASLADAQPDLLRPSRP